MKSGFRYFCFICASLLATQVFAADMSGWSDKTVCRLVKSGGGQEHIEEAKSRGLACGAAVTSASKKQVKAFVTAPVPSLVSGPQASIIQTFRLFYPDAYLSQNKYINETITFDFNNDGLLDVLSTARGHDGVSIEIALNNGDRTFSDGTSEIIIGKIPKLVHAREIIQDDFNGDAITDFYIIGHGYDANPFPGEQNVLLLSNGDGTWSNQLLPRATDFTHSATSGDIDNDGDIDIYVGNVWGGKQISPYMLINNGIGEFTKNTKILPRALKSFNIKFTTSLLFDANNDGWLDLIGGNHDGEDGRGNKIYLSKRGSFSNSSVIKLPVSTTFRRNEVLDTQIYDFNNDGFKDVLFLSTKGPYYVDHQIQILINDGASNFIDATDEYIPNYVHDGHWSKYVHIADINNDGYDDLLLEGITRRYFLNDGTGVFATPGILKVPYGVVEVVNLDSDPQLELLIYKKQGLKGFGLMDTR
jgi:hypothetical protein